MDIRSLTKCIGLMTFGLSSALLIPNSYADINTGTDSEDRFWISRSHENLAKVDNFQAATEQTLSYKALPITSDITFIKPNTFYQKVTQPESLKGFEASYRDNTITLHDPINKQVLKVKGLQVYKKSSSVDRIRGIFLYNKENYEQEFTPAIHVADRLSVGIDLTAKNENFEIKKVEAFADYHYSLFMQANFIFNQGIESKIKNTHIVFNQADLTLPTIDLTNDAIAKDTNIIRWDFSKKHVSKKKIGKITDTKIKWPEDKEDNWEFEKHQYYPQGSKANAAAYYYSDNYFLITLTKPSNNTKFSNPGVEINLEGTQVTLNQFPTFSHLEFDHKGIRYTLLSNTHPESLLGMIKGMLKD